MTHAPAPVPRVASSASPARARTARRSSALRGAVSLAGVRLRETRAGRLGVAAAALISVGYAAFAVALWAGGGAASLDGLLGSAARWLAWGAAGPMAVAAAGDRSAIDRRDGIDVLVASRGISGASLHSARSVAAMVETARVVVVPLLLLVLLAALLSGSLGSGLQLLVLGGSLVAFGVVGGITLGGLAALSGRIGARRGRTLFVALIFIPWALADLAGSAGWSIPGALDAVLSLATGAAGGLRE